jgi:hypothetical protein
MRRLLIPLLIITMVSPVVWIAYAEEQNEQGEDSTTDRAASDVALIAKWIAGTTDVESFGKPFDNGISADAKDALFYTDVQGVQVPEILRQVPYEFAKARFHAVKNGHDLDPAILITRSVAENPKEGIFGRDADMLIEGTGHRFYYIEYSTGSLGSHWMKIAVWEDKDVTRTLIMYEVVS